MSNETESEPPIEGLIYSIAVAKRVTVSPAVEANRLIRAAFVIAGGALAIAAVVLFLWQRPSSPVPARVPGQSASIATTPVPNAPMASVPAAPSTLKPDAPRANASRAPAASAAARPLESTPRGTVPAVRAPAPTPTTTAKPAPIANSPAPAATPGPVVSAADTTASIPAATSLPSGSTTVWVAPLPSDTASAAAAETPAASSTSAGGGAAVLKRRAVDEVLGAYKRAFDTLEPSTAAAVWPGVDTRELGRAFNSVRSQNLVFEKCDVEILDDLALARCSGLLRYVPRVGAPNERTRQLNWVIEMSERDSRWLIRRVTATEAR